MVRRTRVTVIGGLWLDFYTGGFTARCVPNKQVVLSGAICTKNGKALMARQFVEMSRIRIEGLLAAFPKLMGSGEEKQHTFIETDTVR